MAVPTGPDEVTPLASRAIAALEDYGRLRAEFQALEKQFDALQKQVSDQGKELHLQFVRIAQLQAVLDEERQHDAGHADRSFKPPPSA